MAAPTVSVDPASRRVRVPHYDRAIPLPEWDPLVQSWCRYRLAAGRSQQTTRTHCYRTQEFLAWCKREYRIGATKFTWVHAWWYLRHVEGTPNARLGRLVGPATLRNHAKAINEFGAWLTHHGHRDSYDRLSWSDYTNGPGQHPPKPLIKFERSPEIPEQITAETSIEDLMVRYRADSILNRMSPLAAQKYTETIRTFLPWCERFLGHSPAQLTRSDVHAYVQHITESPKQGGGTRSPNTVKRYYDQLKHISRWAWSAGLLEADITEGLKGPRGRTNYLPPPPTETVVRALRTSFEGRTPVLRWRNYTILMFFAYTGVRRGELTGLTRDQVEGLDEVIVTGKGEKQRVIGIAPDLKRAIDRYLDLRVDRSPAFLINQDGNPLAGYGVGAVVKRVSRLIGKPLMPHALRRWHFSQLANQGANLVAMKAAGGWSSLAAAEHYIHTAGGSAGVEMQQAFTIDGVDVGQ